MAKRRYRIDKSVLAISIPKRIRDEEHRKFIASLPCVRTLRPGPNDCSHISHELSKGIACKTGDDNSLPLCREQHSLSHQLGELSFWGADLERAKRLTKELYAHTGNVEYGTFLVNLFYQGK